ncbi:CobQ-like glutamine amidotransferase family enzyme [Caldanaerobacter subterraneus subsp. tengcongensis MB4]|uniref:Lipid II isoglutaminyl synthase (glutamine-hydrolyzing) subunit GatD n=2 Tax=Caldanaerobacter subterraneus TaxID=911092 RepID=Q8RDL0_CALS4|nr:glutamine amidotransferase [Caldanaerobacter subterraneus]AAM23324.1 predicted glutamine amidotransferase [Caldanaerobacter subterraneus subsp. tengcongensis MB4]MCS3917203.1 CobQ-like glutamine amidotransferase family enzyme [Caldanaerobacter subterraneus subsp. tengcongensis MB4]NNG67598.1 glutamine amidotransferase [Caldanaerobacter subterraneus]
MKLTIGHMYPDLLNLYGDRGNIIALKKRCEWRKIDVEIKEIKAGINENFADIDLLFFGGGSDREQKIVSEDLKSKKKNLIKAIEDGMPVLAICGGYQLLGEYYKTLEGNKIEGLGILDAYTVASNKRLIGNIVVEAHLFNKKFYLVGFENHSGKTFLRNCSPLGTVIIGYGNNGEDKKEGCVYKNVYGTYLHGPLLPKNPEMADILIETALSRKYGKINFEPLEDSIEQRAKEAFIKRFMKK